MGPESPPSPSSRRPWLMRSENLGKHANKFLFNITFLFADVLNRLTFALPALVFISGPRAALKFSRAPKKIRAERVNERQVLHSRQCEDGEFLSHTKCATLQ